MRQRALPASQEVQQKTRELAAMRAQYTNLAGNKPQLGARTGDLSPSELFPRFSNVPDLALQYVRLMRDLKVQETLYTLLVQQLEQSRIEEQKNTPVLSGSLG